MTVMLSGPNDAARSDRPLTFKRPCLLFVEGIDDASFSASQIRLFGQPDLWHIHNMGGKDTAWADLISIAQDDEWFSQHGKAIGLVRDADADPKAAAHKAMSILQRCGLPAPGSPGEVQADAPVRSGYFIVPGVAEPGALEELLLKAVPADRVELVDTYFKEVSLKFPNPKEPAKARLHVAIASYERLADSIRTATKLPEIFASPNPAFDAFGTFILALQS